MKTVQATGRDVIVDDADYEMARHLAMFVDSSTGYARYHTIGSAKARKRKYVHTLITGPVPAGCVVDHINGNKLDNRRDNLRIVTPNTNQANRHKLNRNNRSGIRGVCFNPGNSPFRPWKATIYANYRTVNLGYFETIEEAAAVRKLAEPLYFGESCPEVSA